MSYQVGVSGIHQTDSGLNSVPVLDLRALSKCLKAYQARLLPLRCLQTLVLDGISGSHKGEASRVYQAQTDQDLAT